MKLRELQVAATDKSLSKPLRAHFAKAIGEQLDIQTRHERTVGRVLVAAMVIMIVMTAATGAIAILGSIGCVTVVDKYFFPLWTTFGVGFLGTLGSTIIARLKS